VIKQFENRADGGRQLAARLMHLREQDAIVLGLSRGGVAVAYEIANALHAPLDVLNVRRLPVPWHEELSMGTIGAGVRVLNNDVIMAAGITGTLLEEVTNIQRLELDRRERMYRDGRPPLDLRGRTVIVVDDGIATGATAQSALSVVRQHEPGRHVLAAPVVQQAAAEALARHADEVVSVERPGDIDAIKTWYADFPELTDEDALLILARPSVTMGL
jgi:predicted phosphoribosyltransferase